MLFRKKKNTTLIYDENTRLFKVKEKEDTERKIKIFLEQKKIYFETIMMLVLSIAGIIVSIVSVNVAMVANDISLNEQRIADLEKQPSFILDIEADDEKLKYIIKNVGGDIKDGNVLGDEVFIVSIYTEQYDYLGKGYIYLGNYFSDDFSQYDFETKSFELYSTLERKPVLEWMDKIEKIIIEQGYFCGMEVGQCLDFHYKDYKQEHINKIMLFQSGMMKEMESSDKYEFKIRVNINDLEEEQISNEIIEQLGLLERYNNHH